MTREEAYNRIDAIISKHEIDDEYVTITNHIDYDALRIARKALEHEPLTDKEQRIFLAAMGREAKVCKDIDKNFPYREPYEDTLVSVCKSIKRKVQKALWE